MASKKVILLALLFSSFASCSAAKTKKLNKEWGGDAEYFFAMKSINEGDIKKARISLNKALKKGSGLIARRSAETLCNAGDVQQKVESAKKLVSLYPDEEAKLIAARVFFENNEIGQLLSVTSGINIKETDDSLVALKLRGMENRKIQGLSNDVVTWFLEKPLTKEHSQFYSEVLQEIQLSEKEKQLVDFRMEVFRRNYKVAFEMLPSLAEDLSGLSEYLVSDVGKTHLYGSEDFSGSAVWFQKQAELCKGTPNEFYCWFYAGRMYEKLDGYITKTSGCYEKAVNCTDNPQKRDNALWYLLKVSLKESLNKSLEIIYERLPQMGDAEYFDDFFDMLSPLLLTQGYYREIGRLANEMKGHASKEAVAKYSYIYARLIQEGIYNPQNEIRGNGDSPSSKEEVERRLKTALESATDLYYKVQAAKQLGYSDKEFESVICSPRKEKTTLIFSPEADRLLLGYASFGFPEKIYQEWVKLGQPLISEVTTISICRLLQKCSDGRDDYFPQSLRIASRYANYSPEGSGTELMKFCFPKCYEELISKYAEMYGIEPEVLFALIRSESFFDSDVISSAGAVGLSQLMKFTAEDVAKRLKKTDYDLTDPETNIQFGAWYLGNLISRLNGNYLDAFYSYNAGISRVRKWKQSSAFGFGLPDTPEDLFLETLPYAETREYGRKLVSATELYKFLY